MQARVTSVGLLIRHYRPEHFEYPSHIDRASLDALPSKPGIYIFRDELGVALYIGKSVNIRNRVLSHLRTAEEARMLAQTAYIEFERTAGEIGALLLESRLIKEIQPVYNKLLRHSREMCTLYLPDGDGARTVTPEVIYACEHDFATTDNLYGLFATRRAAQEAFRAIVERNKLCQARTGLEKVARGRACFGRQLSRCLGACTGEESAEQHDLRLRVALQDLRVMMWPHEGAIGIVEECDGWRQTHVVDRWFYVGSLNHGMKQAAKKSPLCSPARAQPTATRQSLERRSNKRHFDVDTYKILVRPMLTGALNMVPVDLGRQAA